MTATISMTMRLFTYFAYACCRARRLLYHIFQFIPVVFSNFFTRFCVLCSRVVFSSKSWLLVKRFESSVAVVFVKQVHLLPKRYVCRELLQKFRVQPYHVSHGILSFYIQFQLISTWTRFSRTLIVRFFHLQGDGKRIPSLLNEHESSRISIFFFVGASDIVQLGVSNFI